MSITREWLESLGITDSKIQGQICTEHSETLREIREERDRYKTDAGKLADVQKQLDEAQKSAGDYTKEHEAFEAYKQQTEKAAQAEIKKNLYSELLSGNKVNPAVIPLILKATNYDALEVKDGKFANADEINAAIQKDYAAHIVKEDVKGTNPRTPREAGNTMTREEFSKLSYDSRVEIYEKNPELYKAMTE